VRNSDGTYTIAYSIVVINVGSATGDYDLEDRLVYGPGITVQSASIANTAPGGIVTNGGWNGTTALLVVSDQVLAPGESHAYTVTARAAVPAGLSGAARDCSLAAGESGTGFRNESTLTTNGVSRHDDACASPEPPELARQSLPRTGADLGGTVVAGIGCLLVWALLLVRRRLAGLG
jgi:LPXTG-motif cell wall-anchored protein